MHRLIKTPLALFAALALTALVVAGCGSKSSSSTAQSPEEALKSALVKTSTITSGKAALKGAISVGSLPGSISVSGGGVFDTKADGGPAIDLQLAVQLAGSPQKFGFVAVDGQNYLVVGDKAVKQKKSEAPIDPGQIAAFIKALGENATNVKQTADNTYTASVNVKKLFAQGDKESNGKLSKLSIPGLGNSTQLAKSLGSTTITVMVNPDGYAQSMDINMTLKSGSTAGGMRIGITLSEINQPQSVSKPKNVVSDASALGALGSAISGQ